MAIDARLRWVLEERSQRSGALADAVEVVAGPGGLESAAVVVPQHVDVMVRAVPGADARDFERELKQRSLELHTLGGVARGLTATGRIALDDLADLDASPLVARVEAPRELSPELTISRADCRASDAHALVPPARGGRALVGVIDSGVDYTHAVFKRAGGRTRILAIWDQSAAAALGGAVPYGRVHTQAEIDAAIAGNVPLGHWDYNGHGTHVASIAAGCNPRDGVACDADLLVVALGGGGQTLGRSKNAVDAFDWIVAEASRRQRPVAINMSQGMNGGGHAGSSLLELAMDAHCREPGVALVKSAGNEQEWRTHASGIIPQGGVLTLEVECRATKLGPGQLELWFDETDDVEVSVQPPVGPSTAWLNLANLPSNIVVAGGNRVRLDVEYDPEGTGDNLLTVFLSAGGSAIGIVPGTWRVLLRAASLPAGGLVHAWLERTARSPASEQLRFSSASNDATCTISVPGTARRALTIGSYVTTASPPGSALFGALSSFSSCGPTRYGVQKPDLIAPGEWIEAARSSHSMGAGAWVSMPGTSMAAPHAAGAAAVLLSEDATLTGEQVRQILARSARATGSSPDSQVGAGYLDVEAAVTLLRAGGVSFPVVTSAVLTGTTFTLTTRHDTTASLLYDTNPGRVAAGRRLGSLPSLTLAPTHVFDLSAIGSGTWHFEVHVFASGWRTIADDAGAPWSVTVP